MELRLHQMDVDVYFDWLSSIERKILTDSISPLEEKQLLHHIHHVSVKHYHFIRLYETLQHFRDYLLIRMRLAYYEPVSGFLNRYRSNYRNAIKLHAKLNDATFDIIRQHSLFDRDTKKWIDDLKSIFRDKELDAYTRYRAVVRLMYIFYNYRNAAAFKEITLELDKTLYDPVFYSKRILANYYANRSMMHQRLWELEEAENYGWLSVRQQNNDYLFYINNLCGILIKRHKYGKAMRLMQQTFPELKKTNSMFNRVGFVSLYIKVLVFNGKNQEAESYAETFRDVHKKEIFQYRWHLFYEAYLLALFRQNKYGRILAIVNRNNLLNMEKRAFGKTSYLPTIRSFYSVASYIETFLSEERLMTSLSDDLVVHFKDVALRHKQKELLDELYPHIPNKIDHLRKLMKARKLDT